MLDGIAGHLVHSRKISRKILRPTFLFALLFTFAATSARAQVNTFVATGNLVTSPRYQHTATLLSNGTVLITGGLTASATTPPAISTLASAELYDPTTLAFAATGNMTTSRAYHTATLLSNGDVLISGGATTGPELASVELYDPTTGVFTATGSMSTARQSHTATLLSNGKVLIAGGGNSTSGELASAELYDPSSGTFSTTGSMIDPRYSHTATLLNSGKVLVAGGYGPMPTCQTAPVLNTAELYDPTTGTFTATGSMDKPRFNHTATLLNNNLVLVAAGDNGTIYNLECNPVIFNLRILPSAELYDPAAGTFALADNLIAERELHTATLLNDGTVLIAGGSDLQDNLPPPNPSAELFETIFASVLPRFLSFESQAIGTTTPGGGQILTLKNSDESSLLNITQVTINGVNPSDFAETDNCLGSIAVGASCTINVTFTPGGAGTRTGNVVIVNNNSAVSLKVPLSGTGFVGQPAVSLSLQTLVFGNQAAGTTSPPQMVTLTNSGTAALNIQTVAVAGGSDFVMGSGTTCANGSSVAAGSFCMIQVIFAPTAPGQKSAAVTITDNAGDNPQQISLAGTSSSAALSLNPTNVSFPAQFVGTSGLPQTLSIAVAPAGGGFSGNVALTCNGLPTTATCNISATTVSVGGVTAATATVSVATTARSGLPSPAGNHSPREFPGRPTMLLAGLMAMMILAWTYATRCDQRLRWAPALTIALVLGLGIGLTSCGGGGSARGISGAAGTQAGTYTITVSASATSGSVTLTHAAKLTLVVQ